MTRTVARDVAALAAIVTVTGIALDPCATDPIPLGIGRGMLPRIFRAAGFARGAEVGVWKGGFSEHICQQMPGVSLLCVDPWTPYAAYREAKNDPVLIETAHHEAARRLAPFDATLMRMPSRAAADLVRDYSLDFVYIDGNHERAYVLEDLELWTRKLRPGGMLSGHDYRDAPANKPFIQVKDAVDHFTHARGIAPWFVLTGDRTPSFLWVVA